MISVDTKALRAARAAGTPGEWVRGRRPWAVPEGVELPDPQPWEVFSQENVLGCCEVLFSEREADAELAAVAVNAIDPVCDELERLREMADEWGADASRFQGEVAGLRAELERLRNETQRQAAETVAGIRENTRLREALADIAAWRTPMSGGAAHQAFCDVRDVARKALGGT